MGKYSSEYGAFHKEGYPKSRMVYFMENPNLKWMGTGGTPISGNLQINGMEYGLTNISSGKSVYKWDNGKFMGYNIRNKIRWFP